MENKERKKRFNQEVSELKCNEQLCDLDGKSYRVKFKVTKYIPKIVIDN